ncbi:MAG: coenzyme F420-0:L-glutamate ligase, partial [Methanomicrobiales archaeon]|nr:coenzyme F420-0:L-glutamate ligase [Methanomicrobiales archaeon]
MARSFSVHALKTPLIRAGDDLAAILFTAATRSTARGIRDGDVIVVAESPVATAEGSAVVLDRVIPSARAVEMAARYRIDPRVAEVVLRESDEVVGGIDGFLLSMVHGTLLPNAGVDLSNTPPGTALPLPNDPNGSAVRLRQAIQDRTGAKVAVIIADSRTHA